MQRVTTSSYPSDSLPNRWHIAMRLTGKTLGYTLLVGIGLALLVTACLKCHLLEEVNHHLTADHHPTGPATGAGG